MKNKAILIILDGFGIGEDYPFNAVNNANTPFIKKDTHGSLHMPVYDSAAFEFDSAEEIQAAFLGQKPRHAYSRITNPTIEHLEQKVKNLTDALAVVAVASGMAAIANVVLSIAGQGDNIITTKHVFGNTYSLFEKTLGPWGLKIRYADFSRPATVKKLIDKNTRAIFFETIMTNHSKVYHHVSFSPSNSSRPPADLPAQRMCKRCC